MPTMNAKDSISGAQGVAYVTLDNQRYRLANLININARMTKTKTSVPIIGKSGKGNKATGWEGTGSMTMHFNTPIFRRSMQRYAQTGEDFYFPIQITNEDPSAAVGRQTTILTNCNIDSIIVAQLDADSDYLEEDFDFTFDGIEYPEEFAILPEML